MGLLHGYITVFTLLLFCVLESLENIFVVIKLNAFFFFFVRVAGLQVHIFFGRRKPVTMRIFLMCSATFTEVFLSKCNPVYLKCDENSYCLYLILCIFGRFGHLILI